MDASLGMQDPRDVARRMRGDKNETNAKTTPSRGLQASGEALGDAALANNLRQQAAKMSNEAKGLLAEAARLEKEAASLDPIKAEAPKAKKSKKKVEA